MSAASYIETSWTDLYFPNQRYVDLNFLARNLWCSGCNQPLSLRNLVDDRFEESELQLLCSWCESVIDVPLITLASAQFHKKHSVDKPRFGRNYSRKQVVINEGENEKPPENNDDHSRFTAKPKYKKTKHFQRGFLRTKTEPIRNEVAAVKRSLSPKSSNSRSVLKKKLSSNMLEDPMQDTKIELTDANSGDGQDFELVFQEDPFTDDDKEQIEHSENSNDIALAGSGDIEEYEIPDWVLKPIISFNFDCGYCYQLFDNPVTRHQHLKDQHSDFNNLKCWCGKTSSSRELFGQHRSNHKNAFLCHTCGKVIANSKHYFNDHLKICGDFGDPLQCELCPKMFKTAFSLKMHIRVHATRKLKCAHCSKKFLRKTYLTHHMALHTKDFAYKCHLCPAKFTRADNLRGHVENNHKYMCFLCRKQFSSADLAKLHVQSSHTQAEIAASETQGGFMRITKFECTVCGRCLATKQALQNHARTHQKNAQAIREPLVENAGSVQTP